MEGYNRSGNNGALLREIERRACIDLERERWIDWKRFEMTKVKALL